MIGCWGIKISYVQAKSLLRIGFINNKCMDALGSHAMMTAGKGLCFLNSGLFYAGSWNYLEPSHC